ncbi:MAG: endolytic transglycosylase MltG, partial [Flavobacterium sp.]
RGYDKSIKPGKFEIKDGMNNHALLQALRMNIPVRLTFNNQERIENLAGRISTQIEADSLSLLNAFKDPEFLKLYEVNEETVLALFIPNTYEFYWNTTAPQFRDKMAKEYIKFWNKERIEKAALTNLTPIEVSILASIVQKETAKVSERPRVAGVYLNRLRIGMPLQADPTVIYGIKKDENNFDLEIKRVLLADLSHPSKYNTYDNSGLPPGLIFMPDVNAIDAVLDYEKHNYFYFCASVEKMGYHEFATTLPQHAVNRRKYQKWINSIGINR